MELINMKKIAVYLGSRSGKQIHQDAAQQLGRRLAQNNFEIIYGGANVGTMGLLANAALAVGGKVIGVYPKEFKGKKENHSREIIHKELSELILVDSMSHRKEVMEAMSDACIIMPGSFGTFDEFFEYVVNKQLDFHTKPIYALNLAGYYSPLIAQIDNMIEAGFIAESERSIIAFCDTVEEIIALLLSSCDKAKVL